MDEFGFGVSATGSQNRQKMGHSIFFKLRFLWWFLTPENFGGESMRKTKYEDTSYETRKKLPWVSKKNGREQLLVVAG